MSDPISSTTVIVHGIFAFFGAIVHALDSHRKGKSKSLLEFFALTVMSSFSGAMFALIGLYFFPENIYITAAIAGTGGFLGVEGMAIVVDRVKNLISSK